MSLFDPEYRNALAAFLASEKAGYNGSPQEIPADYASSAPLSQNPTRDVAMGGMQMVQGLGQGAVGSALPGMMGPLGWVAGPALMARGALDIGQGGARMYRGRQQQTGQHPDQAQMDEYLRLMQYYGQSPNMGPR